MPGVVRVRRQLEDHPILRPAQLGGGEARHDRQVAAPLADRLEALPRSTHEDQEDLEPGLREELLDRRRERLVALGRGERQADHQRTALGGRPERADRARDEERAQPPPPLELDRPGRLEPGDGGMDRGEAGSVLVDELANGRYPRRRVGRHQEAAGKLRHDIGDRTSAGATTGLAHRRRIVCGSRPPGPRPISGPQAGFQVGQRQPVPRHRGAAVRQHPASPRRRDRRASSRPGPPPGTPRRRCSRSPSRGSAGPAPTAARRPFRESSMTSTSAGATAESLDRQQVDVRRRLLVGHDVARQHAGRSGLRAPARQPRPGWRGRTPRPRSRPRPASSPRPAPRR